MSIENLVNISRLFIPIIAFIGMYIAWLQFTANRERIKFELYDKRFNIYSTVFKFIDILIWEGDRSLAKEYAEFDLACHEAEFLLPESINVELRELKESVRSWRNATNRITRLKKREGNENKVAISESEIMELENQIEQKGEQLMNIFKEVLKFERF